jgi:hypothetical protein
LGKSLATAFVAQTIGMVLPNGSVAINARMDRCVIPPLCSGPVIAFQADSPAGHGRYAEDSTGELDVAMGTLTVACRALESHDMPDILYELEMLRARLNELQGVHNSLDAADVR